MNGSPIPANPRGFVLCADDYAMTPGVSRGILELAGAQRITATGAMTNRPHWPVAAQGLRNFDGHIDLGVHLNLTCGAPLTQMPQFAAAGVLPRLPVILGRGIAGLLPQAEIEAELAAQLSAFEDRIGRAPDFIDGHQHVHAMPGVRRALAKVLSDRYPAGARPWLRDASDAFAAIGARKVEARKARLVSVLTRPFAVRMRALGFELNAGFSGYSAFDPGRDYGADFSSYLVATGERHLVMCHPGYVDDELLALDPATESRPNEVEFLRSNRFLELCDAAGCEITVAYSYDENQRVQATIKDERSGKVKHVAITYEGAGVLGDDEVERKRAYFDRVQIE